MYPQSKFSGYERGASQAWQPEPQVHAWPPAQPQAQAELMWPPPALHSVPLTYEHAHAGMRAYAAPKSSGRWMATFGLVVVAFGAGVFARPMLEFQVRDLPWGASLPFVGAISTSVAVEASVSEAVFMSPTLPVNTSPLPTPRVTSIATPSEFKPAPVVRAERPSQVVAAKPAMVATAPLNKRARRSETPRPRLALRNTVDQPRAALEKVAPVVAPSEAEIVPVPAVVTRKEVTPAPAPDSLDGLMNRAFVAAPEAHKPAPALMRFPNEKRRTVAARPEPSEAPSLVKPESITGDVAAAATAAAKASAASVASVDERSVVLPKIPSKVRLSDDPLSGLNGKEIEGKRQAKTKPARRK
jgi:hypothetical protein